ncbi:hypothetical protein [uncultured Aquimarina sp.]|uniref:hypothetical protein n=1 Tax=uncultured Aquimarina sp. TaxID=575652 RepID=UPI00260847A9|nr:hypothetical protein [uncultured Aquimarina sp.]
MGKKIKEIPYGIRIARNKYSFIASKEKTRKNAYSEIKEELTFPELCESVDYLEKKLNKRWQELLWGNALPNDYSELGNLKEYPYIGHNISSELNFVLISIRKYKFEINLFLNYKEQYEICLLTGNYDEAELLLDKIENEICFSLWTLENRFLLKEMSGNALENKEFLNLFNQVNKSKSITSSIAHYLSLRAEHSLSTNKYNNDLEDALESIPESGTKQAFQNYYRFRLTFLNHIDFIDYAEILSLDFGHSIIDRYLHLVRMLSNLLVVSSYLKDREDVQSKQGVIKRYILNRVNYLIKKVKDPVLYKLKLLAGDQIFPAFDVQKSLNEIRILDKYTSGLYSDVEKELKNYLINNPNQFDLYLIYIKSLVYQNKHFEPVGKKGSIQNQILLNLHKIISVEGNPDQAGHNLLRIANNLTSCTISYGITDFVYFQSTGKEERNMLAKISYNLSNPIIHEIFNSDEDKIKFLDLLEEKFPDSITIKFFKEKIKGIENLMDFKEYIPEGKFKVEYARKLQDTGDYIGAIEHWEYLKKNYKNTIPILETTIVNLFNCFQKLNRINDCLKLYVDCFFYNNYIVEKIETGELLKSIHSEKFRNVDKTIDLPLFYTIVDADEVETHIAFELFNLSHNVEKPSELIDLVSIFDKERFNFYIEKTCRSKILMHSPFISNSKQRLEERLILLNYVKNNHADRDNILDEIKSIENILIIQQGLIDLDESKIYVNEEGIINNELQDFEAIYERFEIISGITRDNKSFLMLEGGKLTTFVTKENTEYEKIEYSNNPVYEIYYELFNAVKDKFLNSQFGIVAYLSTRIRHGVLVGELRPIFETHKLITLKQGNSSNYRRNVHWDLVFKNFGTDEKEQIQHLLNDFSSKIDGLIFDLIKKYLQVYKKDINEYGWFNYDFDHTDLWLHSIDAISTKSFDQFINKIFKILWQRTDENLELIRGKIEKEILEKFNDYFDDLELKITNQFGSTNCQQLLKEIKNCSTEVQTVMSKISRWFKRSEIKANSFMLSDLITLVSEHVNRSNLSKTLSIEEDLQFNPKIKGEFKTHLADLLRIFLENILKHSSDQKYVLKCKIKSLIDSEHDFLVISVENEITNEESIEALKAVWNNNTMDVKKLISEGKSGYHKAYKILTSDLKSNARKCISTSISDNEEWFKVLVNINLQEIRE